MNEWRTIAEREMIEPMSAEERGWLRCQRLATRLIEAGKQKRGVRLAGTFVKHAALVSELRRRGFSLTHDAHGEWFAEEVSGEPSEAARECAEALLSECADEIGAAK